MRVNVKSTPQTCALCKKLKRNRYRIGRATNRIVNTYIGIISPTFPLLLRLLLVIFVFVIIYYLYCVFRIPADLHLLSRL